MEDLWAHFADVGGFGSPRPLIGVGMTTEKLTLLCQSAPGDANPHTTDLAPPEFSRDATHPGTLLRAVLGTPSMELSPTHWADRDSPGCYPFAGRGAETLGTVYVRRVEWGVTDLAVLGHPSGPACHGATVPVGSDVDRLDLEVLTTGFALDNWHTLSL